MSAAAVVPRADFIPGPNGPLFSCLYSPEVSNGRCLLFVQSLGEELNRCRSIVSMQARVLASVGVTVLVADLSGTGDSAGEHADATWSRWLEDLRAMSHWLSERERPVTGIWALRTGALLANAYLSGMNSPAVYELLLWQPVLSGEMFLRQLLRVRLAAAMRQGGARESTDDLVVQLRGGVPVEVTGYELHPELGCALLDARLDPERPPLASKIHWLQSAGVNTTESNGLIQGWRQQGISIGQRRFQAPAFWQLHQRCSAPDLIQCTTALYQ